MRKIIQITATTVAEMPTLFALCDDGTLWKQIVWDDNIEWELVSPIPQVNIPIP